MELAENLYIVGAGFSFNAGLPLASGFTTAMLTPATPLSEGETNAVLNKAIRRFVNDVFGDGREVPPDQWPPLEDIFTTIDLAANAGHNLGIKYTASALRTLRRALIVRFMRMLRIAYNEKRKVPDRRSEKLQEVIMSINLEKSAFLSLNWDTVLEDGLSKEQKVEVFDYGCDAKAAGFSSSYAVEARSFRAHTLEARILKPHGSINWMYCDCCSRLNWFRPSDTARIAARLLKTGDRDFIKELIGEAPRRITAKALCPDCRAEALGTRFATFSYRKALDFPMHLATWREAERQLRMREIGYLSATRCPRQTSSLSFCLSEFKCHVLIHRTLSWSQAGVWALQPTPSIVRFSANEVSRRAICILTNSTMPRLPRYERSARSILQNHDCRPEKRQCEVRRSRFAQEILKGKRDEVCC